MILSASQISIFRSLMAGSKSHLAYAAGRNVATMKAEDGKTLTIELLAAGFLPETSMNGVGETYATGFWEHESAALLVTVKPDGTHWTFGNRERPIYVHELEEIEGGMDYPTPPTSSITQPASPIIQPSRFSDSCEWNPDENRSALSGDPDHAKAEWIVGGRENWRLCEGCSQLPRFKRLRKRIRINTKAGLFAPQEDFNHAA